MATCRRTGEELRSRAHCLSGRARRLQRGGGAAVRRRRAADRRAEASKRCSTAVDGGTADATASCRSRTRLAAAFTATTTCCSSTSCRSSARSSCRSCTTCWRCPARRSAGLRRVYSHPQALAQCERFLRTLTGVEIIATYDTAGSAKMVADAAARRTPAAIASARAGEVFGLDAARLVDPGLRRQHHALPRDRPRAARRTASPTRRRSSSRCRTSRARCSRR